MFNVSKNKLRLNSVFFFYIFFTRYENVFSVDSGLFDVRTDLESVEKLTFDYLKNTRKSIRSVCDLPRDNKVTLCWSYLTSEEYEFKFHLNVDNDSLNMNCADRKISMKMLDQRKLNGRKSSMFKCPRIAEDFLLAEAPLFYISDSGSNSVAIIYKQKNSRAAIYPHKYIREIDFDELNLRTEAYIRYKLPLSLPKSVWYEDVKKKRFISLDYTDYRKLALFQRSIDAIEISDPYAKFRAFFRATDVCGLRINQKVFLCREILTDFDLDGEDLYADEYSDGRCAKIIAEGFGAKQVSAIQCPPVVVYDRSDESSDSWETMHSTSLHFLTKTVLQARFIAIESAERRWKIHFQAAGINLQILRKVRQIERDSLYPDRRQIGGPESASISSYQGTEKNYPFIIFPIETNRKMAENFVMELVRIKKINSPYEKFRVTFSVQNVCHLRLKQKFQLCQEICENQVFDYKMAAVTEMKCNKKNVFLVTTRITIPIRSFTLMALSCPLARSWPPFQLHLSGSPESNSVLILEQSFRENEVTARTIFRGPPLNKPQIIRKPTRRWFFF